MKWLLVILLTAIAACSQDNEHLVPSRDIVGDGMPQSLTDQRGDAARGRSVFSDRDQGHCVLCHAIDDLDVAFQGDIGPDLSNVGNRLTEAQLRLRIVDYQLLMPGALMPSYFRIHDLYQVGEEYAGDPILTAQQVEDVVSYLSELKE